MQVIKRDGRLMNFNKERIVNAVTKAMVQTPLGIDIDLANKIANSVEKHLENEEQVNVYAIQDLVEKKLMGSSRKEVAQAYITYRYNRDIARKSKTKEVFLDIISAKSSGNIKKNINTTKNTPRGIMMKFASEVTKPLVDAFLLLPEARQAEKNGYIYIHDKDYYSTKALKCLQYPLNIILKNGFRIDNKTARPPERIETAINLTSVTMEMIQNEIIGGQSIPAFDFFLAPYVKKAFIDEVKKQQEEFGIDMTDSTLYQPPEYIKREIKDLKDKDKIIQIAINRTVERVHQAMEAFIHNMNIVQDKNKCAFTSINYGTDTSPEGRCIIREILNATYEGVGNGETAVFPIQVWKKKKGINYLPEDKNYDLYKLSWKVTAKRFYPNYINLDATFNENEKWSKEDKQRWYYECATIGGINAGLEDRHGEKTVIGKGILSSITMNLPKIAIEASLKAQDRLGMNFELGKNSAEKMTEQYKKTVKKIFLKELEQYITIAARQLYERFKFQCTATSEQFPLLMSGLWMDSENLKYEETISEKIKHGTLSIGFTGLSECLIALTGKHHGESEEAQKLGIEIITEMKDLTEEFSEKYNLNYSVIGTPEDVSYEFILKDKTLYGIIPGVTDKKYYTNSNHIPIEYQCTAEHKAQIEAPYHELCKAGHTFYVEVDTNTINNPEAIGKIVDLTDKYNIGYVGINHAIIKCADCGFESLSLNSIKCEKCGSENIDTMQKIETTFFKNYVTQEERATHTGIF